MLPEVERLGASLVAISPLKPEELARLAAERGLRLTMLSDVDDAYARLCGVHYAMSDGQARLYRKRGVDLEAANAGAGWQVPVPATYVLGQDGLRPPRRRVRPEARGGGAAARCRRRP
jgi:peroxiredoxin